MSFQESFAVLTDTHAFASGVFVVAFLTTTLTFGAGIVTFQALFANVPPLTTGTSLVVVIKNVFWAVFVKVTSGRTVIEVAPFGTDAKM